VHVVVVLLVLSEEDVTAALEEFPDRGALRFLVVVLDGQVPEQYVSSNPVELRMRCSEPFVSS